MAYEYIETTTNSPIDLLLYSIFFHLVETGASCHRGKGIY